MNCEFKSDEDGTFPGGMARMGIMKMVTRIGAVVALAMGFSGCGGGIASPTPKQEVRVSSTSPAPTKNFAEHGRASYYGAKFQGRPTASGEPFDKEKMTAAHPKLAFGTLVKVTNVANGQTVTVRINDRFGGHAGRVIDLSEAAFKAISPIEAGVITVTLQVQ